MTDKVEKAVDVSRTLPDFFAAATKMMNVIKGLNEYEVFAAAHQLG